MEIKDMTIEQLEERKAAISAEVDAPEADLDALESEARAINTEIEERKAAEAQREEIRIFSSAFGSSKVQVKDALFSMPTTCDQSMFAPGTAPSVSSRSGAPSTHRPDSE